MAWSKPVYVIVTLSPTISKILPRVLEPAEARVIVRPHAAEAMRDHQGASSVIIVDLNTIQSGLEHLVSGTRSPTALPILLMGDPWHLPSWLQGRLGPRLRFTAYPLDPGMINSHLKELLSESLSRPLESPPETGSQPATVEEIVHSLENLLGEENV